MKTRKNILAVTIVLLIVLVAVAVIYIPGRSSKITQAPRPTGDRPGEYKVVYSTISLRVEELNRVLGIPKEELYKLSPAELHEVFVENAELLGVRVYASSTEKGTGEQSVELKAGGLVFKAPDFGEGGGNKTPAPTQTTDPYHRPEKKEGNYLLGSIYDFLLSLFR